VKTIVIGMGNPVLSDDGVGLEIAQQLAERLRGRDNIDVIQMYGGGIALMEAMAGYHRAVIVDAIVTGRRPGTISLPDPTALWNTRHIHSTHDTNLPLALEFGKAAGLQLPADIRVWAVEAADVETVREGLSPVVERAVPAAVAGILAELDDRAPARFAAEKP